MQWQCWMSILHGLTSWNVFPRVISRRPRWCQIGRFAIGWICHFFHPDSSKSVSFLRKLKIYSSFRLKSSTALYTATNFMMKRTWHHKGVFVEPLLSFRVHLTFTLEKCDRNLHTAFLGVFGASTVCVCCSCLWLCLLPALVPLFPRKQEVWQQSCRASTFGQIQSRCVSWDAPNADAPPSKNEG